jgi:cytosine/adenosine deaminase-related metal-dependent hydrolase
MSKILIEKARIWTNGDGLIEDGFVLIEGDKIARVGEMEDRPEPPEGAETIDAKGRLLLPGFVCAHTHLYSALARGLALPGVSPNRFGEILEQFWWRLDKALDPESIYYSALSRRARVRQERRHHDRGPSCQPQQHPREPQGHQEGGRR